MSISCCIPINPSTSLIGKLTKLKFFNNCSWATVKLMFDHIGWKDVGNLIVKAMEKTVLDKDVTYDLERQIEGANLLKCSEFGDAIIRNMDNV